MKFRRFGFGKCRTRETKFPNRKDEVSDLRQSPQFHKQPLWMDRLMEHR